VLLFRKYLYNLKFLTGQVSC